MTYDAACPICQAPRSPWLEMPLDAKTFRHTTYGRVTRCESCGIGGVTPLPDPAEVPAFYILDAYYTQGQSHFADAGPERLTDRIRTHIAWRLDRGEEQTPEAMAARLGRRLSTALDIGCGDGQRLHSFAAMGATVVGIDPDETAVARGRELGLDIRTGTAERASEILAGARFDLIVMSHSLEHCVDPLDALRNVRALLAKDGLFYCEVPNCAALHFETFNIASEMFDAPRHLWFFEPRGLRKMLEVSGFNVEHETYHGFTRHHTGPWRATENRILERLMHCGRHSTTRPPAHTRAESTWLLVREAFAPKERKYDSVGFYVRPAS